MGRQQTLGKFFDMAKSDPPQQSTLNEMWKKPKAKVEAKVEDQEPTMVVDEPAEEQDTRMAQFESHFFRVTHCFMRSS